MPAHREIARESVNISQLRALRGLRLSSGAPQQARTTAIGGGLGAAKLRFFIQEHNHGCRHVFEDG